MERVPKKKKGRSLRPLVLLGVMVFLGAAAGVGVWLIHRAPAALPPLPEREEAALLFSRPTEEIASVTVTPRQGEPYTLLPREEGFVLQTEENTALRESAVKELRLSLDGLPAESVLRASLDPENGLDAAAFGLEPAAARVEVRYQDGETVTLLVGDMTPDEETPQRYCMRKGDPRLFTLLEADSAAFLREKDYLRAFDQPELDGSLLDRIEIAGGVNCVFRYDPSGWQMEAPYQYPAASARMEALLKKISGMGFSAYLGDAEKLPLSAYGLDDPAFVITLTQAPSVLTGPTADGGEISIQVAEKRYSLALGNAAKDSVLYALWEGGVYEASAFLLGFWQEIDPRDYLLRKPVNFLINDLSAVSFSRGGLKRGYEVRMVESITANNQIAVDEYGHTLYDCAVRRVGEKEDIDAETFLSWYTALAGLNADGDLPEGTECTGEPRGEIILENDHLTRTIRLYAWDALHDALWVDGTALFYVQKSWLDTLTDAP